MKHARQVGRTARDQAQRALAIQSFEPVKQLPGNFQVEVDSEPDPDQFIDFGRAPDGERTWTDARQRKIRFFPDGQSANRAFVKFLVTNARLADCPSGKNLILRWRGSVQVPSPSGARPKSSVLGPTRASARSGFSQTGNPLTVRL